MSDIFTAYTVLSFTSLGLLLVAVCSIGLPEEMTGIPDRTGPTNFMVAVVFTGIARCATAAFGTSSHNSGASSSADGFKTLGNFDATLNTLFTTALVAQLPILALGLYRSVAGRGSGVPIRWGPSASRTLILISYAYALLPTAIVLGWAQGEGKINGFGKWWGVYYRPDVSQWRQIRLGILVTPACCSFLVSCGTVVHLFKDKGKGGNVTLHMCLRVGFTLLCAIGATVYLACEHRIGWYEDWEWRLVEGTLGFIVLMGTVNPGTLRCYSAWLRFRRPKLVTEELVPTRPWSSAPDSPECAYTPNPHSNITYVPPPYRHPRTSRPVIDTSATDSPSQPASPTSNQIQPRTPTPRANGRIWNPPPAVRLTLAESDFTDIENEDLDLPPSRKFYAQSNDSGHTFGHVSSSQRSVHFTSMSNTKCGVSPQSPASPQSPTASVTSRTGGETSPRNTMILGRSEQKEAKENTSKSSLSISTVIPSAQSSRSDPIGAKDECLSVGSSSSGATRAKSLPAALSRDSSCMSFLSCDSPSSTSGLGASSGVARVQESDMETASSPVASTSSVAEGGVGVELAEPEGTDITKRKGNAP